VSLPSDAKERKRIPLYSGLVRYFPDALIEVAKVSFIGNEQHHPGEPLHWDRSKSADEDDAMLRHLWDAVDDPDHEVEHRRQQAWRSLAALQKACERRHILQTPKTEDISPDLALLAAHPSPGELPPIGPLITPNEPPLDEPE